MYNPIEHELARARREGMVREVGAHNLAKTARRRAGRGRGAAVAWELERYAGRLRKLFRRF